MVTWRALVLTVARDPWVQNLLTHGAGRALARRFVAGETLAEGLAAARAIAATGARPMLDYLGEAVTTHAAAEEAAQVYRTLLAALQAEGLPATVSLKASQFGLDLDPDRCAALVESVAATAARLPTGVWLDMEDSSRTDRTIALWRAVVARQPNVGLALQAMLYRTPDDLAALLAEGASLRLCKGAYAEPPDRAHQTHAAVDAAFLGLLYELLRAARARPPAGPGQLPTAAIATHDEHLIQTALRWIEHLGLRPGQYEFQLLYGVRRDLQRRLLAAGHPLSIYLPWGPDWYRYLTRRLAERPANVLFLGQALLAELAHDLRRPAGCPR